MSVAPSKFLDPLVCECLDGRKWKVTQPFRYQSTFCGGVLYVFPGFITDFASIPQFVQSIIPVNGPWTWGAVIHDLLYSYNGAVPVLHTDGHLSISVLDREGCDKVLLEAMMTKGVATFHRKAIYDAVRAGGFAAWDEHALERTVYPIEVIKSLRALMADDAAGSIE